MNLLKNIYIDSKILVKDLSFLINKPVIELIKDFFVNGISVKINDYLYFEYVKNILKKIYNINVFKSNNFELLENNNKFKKRTNTIFITVTGNVDNGKSTLIDFIIKKNNTKFEIGDITQNISIYDFIFLGKKIYLFDLPGHSLFNELINTNLSISDIIFYIISYEDNIDYKKINDVIKKFEKLSISIILCINKYDKFKFGKKYLNFKNEKFFISAKNGFNIKNLIKKTILIFNKKNKYLDLRNPGKGIIINSFLKNNTLITNLFIFKGILETGNYINFKYISIKILDFFLNEKKINKVESPSIVTIKNIQFPIETLFEINNIEKNNLIGIDYKDKYHNFYNFYIKVNTHNIGYSILEFYNNLKTNETINIVKLSIGKINDSDINYCLNFNCIIITVGILIENIFKQKILVNKIFFKEFNIVNDLIEYFKNFYKCDKIEKTIGKLKIKEIFPSGKLNKIAGCIVIDGEINIKNNIKIYKNLKLIFKGKIKSIKIKNQNKEIVIKNEECGILIKNFNNYEIGDIIESYIYINDKKYIEF
ncbi:GTP-binding protein [Candidatus Carsonella ruddii]|uniref:Putative translation initiation factor IF-2 n=1 Tax=Candidatus Carsonella ruddii PC isolate NHV TaxID=1202540 RepID=J3TWI1_CARRU|nr:GTP-binding protein [Candidatus Carsonella ruddii]AFP84295.1 putative translation initiation factor IF-2 [Candidatus Carsonella ruddii PC isolate NHV]